MWILTENHSYDIYPLNGDAYILENQQAVHELILEKMKPFGSVHESGIWISLEYQQVRVMYTPFVLRGFTSYYFNLIEVNHVHTHA